MSYALHLTILNIIVSKINLNGAVYQLFPTLPCKQFKLERPSMGKLKFNTSMECLECFDSLEFQKYLTEDVYFFEKAGKQKF